MYLAVVSCFLISFVMWGGGGNPSQLWTYDRKELCLGLTKYILCRIYRTINSSAPLFFIIND
jgi:hypothetical protein